MPFSPWSHRKDFTASLHLPDPEVYFQAPDNRFYPLSRDSIQRAIGDLTVLRLRALTLDIDITQWRDRHQSRHPPLEIWRIYNFPTVRGPISFHLGIVADQQKNDRGTFPEGTIDVRLIRLNKRDRPKMPWLLVRGEPAQTCPPAQSSDASDSEGSRWSASGSTSKETPFSSCLEWVAPDKDGPFYGDFEPDACVLIVQVRNPGVVTRRLGVAYVRMIDFLVAGAEVKEILLA